VKSLRARLLAGLFCSVLLLLLAMFYLIYARIEDEIDDLFDAQMEQTALSFSPALVPLPVATPPRKVVKPENELVVKVWDSATAMPAFESRALAGLSRNTAAGFSKTMIDGVQWRVFSIAAGTQWVEVAQPAKVRDQAAADIALRTVLPCLLLIPLAGLMIVLVVRIGLRPLHKITADLKRRSHRDLSPIASTRLPPDLLPLAAAFNDLMARLAAVIAAQRAFIADAAHELLTPLTALRLQTQMLSRALSPARREEALSELQAGLARTIHLARQLLTLARQDVDNASAPREIVPLAALLRDVVAIHLPLAESRFVQIELAINSEPAVLGQAEGLSTLIANLVDNAVKYSPHGGRVRIELRLAESSPLLLIEDSGPGIPYDERERVFDRFYRAAGSKVGGSGLGLAIAREIAERHAATIHLGSSDALGGLCARVSFVEQSLDRTPDSHAIGAAISKIDDDRVRRAA
jgi:signal transduction histidine kinase